MHSHASESESVDQDPAKNDTNCEPRVAKAVAEDNSGKGVKADDERPNSAAHVSCRDEPYVPLLVSIE